MSYRQRLQFPDIIGVQLGTREDPCVVPAEMCYIPPGQLFKQKLPEQMMDRARTFATKKPGERMDIIMNGVARPGQSQRLITPPV
jgi:eukaryotic translation initiation factor 2C